MPPSLHPAIWSPCEDQPVVTIYSLLLHGQMTIGPAGEPAVGAQLSTTHLHCSTNDVGSCRSEAHYSPRTGRCHRRAGRPSAKSALTMGRVRSGPSSDPRPGGSVPREVPGPLVPDPEGRDGQRRDERRCSIAAPSQRVNTPRPRSPGERRLRLLSQHAPIQAPGWRPGRSFCCGRPACVSRLPLAAETVVAFPSSGSKIAFTSNRSRNEDIFVMDADGTNPVNLTRHLAPDLTPEYRQAVTSQPRSWARVKFVTQCPTCGGHMRKLPFRPPPLIRAPYPLAHRSPDDDQRTHDLNAIEKPQKPLD